MMGQHGGNQDRLFYSFNLDEHVPTAVLAISALAAGVTALLRPMAWYLTAIVGAAIGSAGAFIVSVYAISRI